MKKILVLVIFTILFNFSISGEWRSDLSMQNDRFGLKLFEFIDNNIGFYVDAHIKENTKTKHDDGMARFGVKLYSNLNSGMFYNLAFSIDSKYKEGAIYTKGLSLEHEENDPNEIDSKGVSFSVGYIKDFSTLTALHGELGYFYSSETKYPFLNFGIDFSWTKYNKEKRNRINNIKNKYKEKTIYKGMNKIEVLNVMGKPHSKYVDGNYESWNYEVYMHDENYYYSISLMFEYGILQKWSEYENNK